MYQLCSCLTQSENARHPGGEHVQDRSWSVLWIVALKSEVS